MKKLFVLVFLGSTILVSADSLTEQQKIADSTAATYGNTALKSDQEINQKVRDSLASGWFSKGYDDVTFDVNNGNITLRGSVETLDKKIKVEESVKRIEGVKSVNNQIIINKATGTSNSKNYTESELQSSEKKYPKDTAATKQDRQINAKIRDKISGGSFSKGNDSVVLNTSSGAVTLNGTVDKVEDIQKVENALKAVDGVKSVNNQLTAKK